MSVPYGLKFWLGTSLPCLNGCAAYARIRLIIVAEVVQIGCRSSSSKTCWLTGNLLHTEINEPIQLLDYAFSATAVNLQMNSAAAT
jgi:hypothetical protein